MKPSAATQQLIRYAMYHRDPRNIATHFIGIPLIVLALGVLLAQPVFGPGLTPAMLVWAAAAVWLLLQGQLALTLATALAMAALLWAGHLIAQLGSPLGWGLALFGFGWAFQFVGHIYEGRKPAFLDDVRGLLVGPVFVVAEALFALGAMDGLKDAIERGAGPTRLRDLAAH